MALRIALGIRRRLSYSLSVGSINYVPSLDFTDARNSQYMFLI